LIREGEHDGFRREFGHTVFEHAHATLRSFRAIVE